MSNIIPIILLVLPVNLLCQDSFENGILDRLCGLKAGEKAHYNLGEYAIFTDQVRWEFTSKNIKKLKKKYKVKRIKEVATNSLTQKNKVITKKSPLKGGNMEITTLYFVESEATDIAIIGFYSVNFRDSIEEQNFVKLHLESKIPESIFMQYPVAKVDFAGRDLELNNSCNWMDVNNIQCPHFGQMNWSLHKSLEHAKEQTKIQYEITKGKRMAKLISEEEVPIIFEGKETIAKRTNYKAKIPKFLMRGSNELIIYYVSEEIRGRYISCVLSHYKNDKITENGVPALLEKVMKLKK
ncbi:MAG: hypothetical protein AAF798_00080 [Bacteroidota bacterium]